MLVYFYEKLKIKSYFPNNQSALVVLSRIKVYLSLLYTPSTNDVKNWHALVQEEIKNTNNPNIEKIIRLSTNRKKR